MSDKDAIPVPSPQSEPPDEAEKSKDHDADLETDKQDASFPGILRISNDLQLTACELSIEDGLLEASLEEYQ
jgi:hypothetical protein